MRIYARRRAQDENLIKFDRDYEEKKRRERRGFSHESRDIGYIIPSVHPRMNVYRSRDLNVSNGETRI